MVSVAVVVTLLMKLGDGATLVMRLTLARVTCKMQRTYNPSEFLPLLSYHHVRRLRPIASTTGLTEVGASIVLRLLAVREAMDTRNRTSL